MKRSSRGRRIGVVAWVLGATVTVGALAMALTFSVPEALKGDWPLGIAAGEAGFYAQWLDLRTGDSSATGPERYLFGHVPGACLLNDSSVGWSSQWFEADGFGDSVKVRRLRSAEGEFVVKFRREEPFRAQRHIVLLPATLESIRNKYLEILARELGLVTPEVSFVRVIACGRDQGIYLKEERIDADFLEKQGLAGSSLFTQGHDPARPDHLFPDFEDDTLAGAMLVPVLHAAYERIMADADAASDRLTDRRTAVGLWLMHELEHGEGDRGSEDLFAYDWSKGRIIALYRHGRATGPRDTRHFAGLDFLTGLARDPAFMKALKERRLQLADQRWRLKERFAAMDRAWLPILSDGSSLAFAKAAALRIQDELLGARLNAVGAYRGQMLVRHACCGDAFAQDSVGHAPAISTADLLPRGAVLRSHALGEDTLVFPRGRYAIGRDLLLPVGTVVVIEAGARFEIGAGRSVVVQGPLIVQGTVRNPVFVRAMDEGSPFGTFAVLGDGTTSCSIAGLQLSGGSEARTSGVYFSGQFAIHGAGATYMRDCIIAASQGEDLLNIKGGAVDIAECVFEDGLADLVDLDGCKGRIFRCIFRSGRKDSNGDGLDLSGARVSVWGCTFSGMMDKGISVGEASQLLVRASRFVGNRMALAAKDLSIAYVEGNVFLDNAIVFGAYRKKPIYGGARVMRYANEYVNNGKEQEVDAMSNVVHADALDEKTLRMFPAE
ncbi:MAG: CotH kinase family protein [Flavobacteriales bacterium]|nr:CotH kinase family protein [Flavobacteriales bacterium]